MRSACFNYKLSFSEQLLVYAQRPNATAVLELEKWNKQFGRWVNKGATGIAVFDDEHNGNNRLKYYFDISDTHESRMSRPVPLWDIEQRYEDDVIETLEGTFGTLYNKDDLPTALIYAATNAVEDNFSDYLSELMYCREDSFLEELDELNVEKYLKEALECSVSYMLLERCCGGAADEYRKLVDFSSIMNFNTRETLNALGTATSDIAEMALREIATTVRNLQITEKKQIRTFAENPKVQYPNNTRQINNSERSFDNGNHIQQERRLQHSQSDSTAGNTGNSLWEIRIETETFLKQSRKVMFQNLLTSGKLNEHLMEIEQAAMSRLEQIIPQMAKSQGVTEELKAADQIAWVGLMNNIRHSAEETVLTELVYN